MKTLLSLTAAALALVSTPVWAEDAAGDWAGLLAGRLHVIVHLTKGADGTLGGVMESIDQGDVKIPIGTVDAAADHLKFTVPAVNGGYDGTWDATKQQWTGIWSQGGGSTGFDLHRATAGDVPAAPKRPQEEAIAKGPLPYHDQAVTFDNSSAHVTLAGVISRPEGKGPFPAVVLISGSGPNSRDEAVFDHKLFVVLADSLARRGIAVLRYDKRGIGQSTGDYLAATTSDFTSDAEAAVTFLKSQADIDKRHIGVLGHSEGGLIAPAVAVADPSVNFVVMMAGPGLPGKQIMLMQTALISRASGLPEAAIAANTDLNTRIYAAVTAAKTSADALTAVQAILAPMVASGKLPQGQADLLAKQAASPWMRSFLVSDPVPTLQKMRAPLLAINGSLDMQVPPQEDLAAIKAATSGDKDVTVIELKGLNHLFQDATTGSPAEYQAIEETMSPAALTVVGEWIASHVK